MLQELTSLGAPPRRASGPRPRQRPGSAGERRRRPARVGRERSVGHRHAPRRHAGSRRYRRVHVPRAVRAGSRERIGATDPMTTTQTRPDAALPVAEIGRGGRESARWAGPDATPAGWLSRAGFTLDAAVDAHARAAPDGAVPVRPRRVRPHGRPAGDVPRLQGRLLQRLLVRDRPLGTTDMDIYSSVEIAEAARRTVSALRKFQLTKAVGDPDKKVAPRHLEIPPVIVDMDGGYGNIFNVQRTTELYVNAGVAAAHIEDQVLPKRCGHIGGKALMPANEMVGKLRMARAVADDLGNEDFVIIARTDGLSAVDAPESARGVELASNEPCAISTRACPTSCGASSRRPIGGRSRSGRPRFASGSRRRDLRSTGRLVQVVQRSQPDHLRRAGRDGLQVHLHHARRPARHGPRLQSSC